MLVVVIDVALDGGDARVERVEGCIPEPLPRQLREEALHGVHPGRRGRGEVELPVRPVLQPLVDLGRPVRRDVVEDDMNRGSGVDPPGDMVEEGEEVPGAMARRRLADHLPGGGVEGREQAGGAVSPVVVRPRLGMAGFIGRGLCVLPRA